MYPRFIKVPQEKSFFLFCPRGTGKTSFIKTNFPNSNYIDLLDHETFIRLLAQPTRLNEYITNPGEWVVIDEVQKVPFLLDEVHRLIENRRLKFILTGSSTRKLKRKGVNLLAGRALTKFLYPLTSEELGDDFSLSHSLKYGLLPSVYIEKDPRAYLESYVKTYLKEEIEQEGLTRNLGAFSRFLEQISFSQAQILNVSEIARESSVERKVVEDYIIILEDLLLARRLPIFSRRAKRRMTKHPKFFIFDAGVYRTIRPKGPLDSTDEIDGTALETLVFQELYALNDYYSLGYSFYGWRTAHKVEIDLVLYGERGIKGFEIKRTDKVRRAELKGLRLFKKDYPIADVFFLYLGDRELIIDDIRILPLKDYFKRLKELL